MFYLLLVAEVIIGLLLIGVILLQRSKEHGLGLAIGSGMGESLFGSEAVSVLMKITVVLAVLFFLNTMILARITTQSARGGGIAIQVPRAGPYRPGPVQAPPPSGGSELPAAPALPVESPAPATPAGADEPVGAAGDAGG